MKQRLLSLLRCPCCLGRITLVGETKEDEIYEGLLLCEGCQASWPVKNYIPRFVDEDHYARNFELEWNRCRKTQLDSYTGAPLSRGRLFAVAGDWAGKMEGKLVLEAGCGAGRFTEVLLDEGAEVVAFDLSGAVDANLGNFGLHPKLHLIQADIYRIPLRPEMFDYVLCLGVLQHTPGPREAFLRLVEFLKPGGSIAIDSYKLSWKTPFKPSFWLRPITNKLPPEVLWKAVRRWFSRLLPLRRFVRKHVPGGTYLCHFVPAVDVTEMHQLREELAFEWGILDTYDMLSPKYDKPQTRREIMRWFASAGLTEVTVQYGPNGIIARGRRPEPSSASLRRR
jgi:2-polyprenyl-3-methyl-5-hydroxy-6-metoxy-1,4-benzoquinol methylase